jgi:hypothetical protein
MAIVIWPDDVDLKDTVTCVTCRKEIKLSDATAGALNVDGTQAFACNTHFLNGARLIVGWIDFAIEQDMPQAEMAEA